MAPSEHESATSGSFLAGFRSQKPHQMRLNWITSRQTDRQSADISKRAKNPLINFFTALNSNPKVTRYLNLQITQTDINNRTSRSLHVTQRHQFTQDKLPENSAPKIYHKSFIFRDERI